MLRVVAMALAGVHGGYGFLLIYYSETLWALPTYDTAKSVPGGTTSWIVLAIVAASLLLIGTLVRREVIVGAGATASALWLIFFAVSFAVDTAQSSSPIALPGVLVYSCLGFIAASRAGVAIGRP